MLSYSTPATIARNNEIAERHLAKELAERGTGINSNGSPELSAVQAKDFAAALEARKAG